MLCLYAVHCITMTIYIIRWRNDSKEVTGTWRAHMYLCETIVSKCRRVHAACQRSTFTINPYFYLTYSICCSLLLTCMCKSSTKAEQTSTHIHRILFSFSHKMWCSWSASMSRCKIQDKGINMNLPWLIKHVGVFQQILAYSHFQSMLDNISECFIVSNDMTSHHLVLKSIHIVNKRRNLVGSG